MAYEIIGSKVLQEKIIPATADMPSGRFWVEIVVQQERGLSTSHFIGELWARYQTDEIVDSITYEIQDDWSSFYFNWSRWDTSQNTSPTVSGDGGEPVSALLCSLDTKNSGHYSSSTGTSWTYTDFNGFHDITGAFGGIACNTGSNKSNSTWITYQEGLVYIAKAYADLRVYKDGNYIYGNDISVSGNFSPEVLPINKGVYPSAADNFTDEDNPSITYQPTNYRHFAAYGDSDDWKIETDTITSLQAAISTDGINPDLMPYRNIPITGGQYAFNFTEADRERLRQFVQGSTTKPIYYLIKTVRRIENTSYKIDESHEAITATKRNLTIIGANPSLNPTVKDIKAETLALTGDENSFIRYESMAEFAINPVASKNATITKLSAQCGSKIVEGLPYGIIDDVESGDFTFTVIDSRNLASVGTVFKNLVPYIKPTCYQTVKIEMSGETGAEIHLTVSGNYYNGSFGKVNNTLLLEVRYTNGEGVMGEWQTINATPTFNDGTYEINATISGFAYSNSYVFQCRATDKLNTVESSQYTIRVYPVFDWGEEDFNFNVPVKMDGETVLRHNKEANNTVLSASGGHIYLRPEGTESTYSETIFYPDGSVKVSGNLNVNGDVEISGNVNFEEFSINNNTINDFVIETGEEEMGSNGTWYWRKWASGIAECWGCRNFGNMNVSTAWGNLYRGTILTQDLPEDLFITTPDSININIVHSNFGGWICKHEQTAPSAITTGSFIFVRPASATVSPTNIGFHIKGLWRQ